VRGIRNSCLSERACGTARLGRGGGRPGSWYSVRAAPRAGREGRPAEHQPDAHAQPDHDAHQRGPFRTPWMSMPSRSWWPSRGGIPPGQPGATLARSCRWPRDSDRATAPRL